MKWYYSTVRMQMWYKEIKQNKKKRNEYIVRNKFESILFGKQEHGWKM